MCEATAVRFIQQIVVIATKGYRTLSRLFCNNRSRQALDQRGKIY